MIRVKGHITHDEATGHHLVLILMRGVFGCDLFVVIGPADLEGEGAWV